MDRKAIVITAIAFLISVSYLWFGKLSYIESFYFLIMSLAQNSYSLDHQAWIDLMAKTENLLIIQDLDGVCMELVQDPLTRTMDRKYVEATTAFRDHFFVLTNGEHIGKRGVKGIVERTFEDPELVKEQGFYLPGLAGGGVQWQDCYGNVSHPGVSEAELAFLAAVPQRIENSLRSFFAEHSHNLTSEELDRCIQATILDNKVSPTINLNIFYAALKSDRLYLQLQQAMKEFTDRLLVESADQGLAGSFFVHFAPNLGRDAQGQEIIQYAAENSSGTTDLQFMLRGAIKGAGVLFILNHYYYLKTGSYPLGQDFNSRQAPHSLKELLELVQANFDPEQMPIIIGVGDTVTSQALEHNGQLIFQRGGSDRGFLELVQALGREFETDNLVVYVDSSAGELKNRQALQLNADCSQVISGIGDPRDVEDPLTVNLAFPGGYQQYTQAFKAAAIAKTTNRN